MLLVIVYSRAARTSLRNTARTHDDTVVRRFGRVALLEATELGAFLALRLRHKHGEDVQIERVEPFNEFQCVSPDVREAARRFEDRSNRNTTYDAFATGTAYPDVATMKTQSV